MGTIATSTATNAFTNAFGYPPNSMMDLDVTTGILWIVFKDQTNRAAIYKSLDSGGSWVFVANFNVSGYTLEDICEMRIDPAGDHMHMVLLVLNGSGTEEGHYKRVGLTDTGGVTTTGTIRFTGPAGSNQSVEYTGGLVPTKNPDGSWHIFIAFSQHGSTSGVAVYAITVKNDAALTTTVNNAIIGPTRTYKVSGDDTFMACTVDVEHNGNGITAANPNVWVTWLMNTTLYAVRCTWKGYKTGWQTPTKAAVVGTGRITERDAVGRWDGTRFVIVSVNPAQQAQMQIIERNAANTSTVATRTSPNHPLGTITGARMMSYNYVTKDVRIYALTGAGTVYFIDYFRATNTWGSWVSTGWTTPVVSEWGVRRGSYGTSQYDAYTLTGAASPWTVTSQTQTVNFTPTAPTWVIGTAGTVSQNGAAFDASLNLTLDWDFHDVNKTDTQSAYALQRQIGSGTVQWWRTSDDTWQTVETWNSTATTSVTLTPAQWLGGGGTADPAHVYKVATKDSGSGTLTSPYSSGLSLVPSARVDPTVTAPTVNQILNVGQVGVTWTVAEQSQWRVQVKPTIVNDAFGRTASNGWGTSDYGGAWTISTGTASDFSVSSGTGRMSHAANSVNHDIYLPGVLADDVNIYALVTIPATPTGGPPEFCVRARYIDSNNYVDARIYFLTSGGPQIVVRSLLAGVETFSGFVSPGGITAAGPVALRFVADGGTLYGRIWNPANAEPSEWIVSCPATLTDAGAVMVHSTLPSANTNTKPFVFQVDNLIIQDVSLTSYDSGFVADAIPLTPTTLAHTVPKVLPDGYAGLLVLTTKNAEGLASQPQTVPFTVDFVEPASPIVTLANTPTAGGGTVTVTQPSASGAQPATSQLDVYRRVVKVGTVNPMNANPWFETNASDWTSSGYSTIARSTAQFHEGVASLLCTPDGATASPKAQTTALYPVTSGQRYEFRGWLRSTTANKTVRVYVDWYTSGASFLSSTVQDFTPVAGVWIYATTVGTAPINATQARVAIGQLVTPAAGDTLYGDELQLLAANDDQGFRAFADVDLATGYVDWRTVTGVDYEYRVKAIAGNGTETYGPWVD